MSDAAKIDRRFITHLPLDQATKPPTDGHWDVYANRWWCHEPGKGLLFWRKSPQCNPNESIARAVQKSCHPDTELIFVERVYLRHDCGDYQ